MMEMRFAAWKLVMEAPKLIITEQDGDTPMFGMCSACRAILPTIKASGRDRNSRLLERVFAVHVKAEHSDQAPA
jgi:hypothetical protein